MRPVSVDPDSAEVRASGGVVWRRGEDGVEVLVVHRPRYDDWSLPKAAVREVEEETGLRCALGPELPPVSYRDNKDRPKVVRYWLMEATSGSPGFAANHEVDELRWLPAAEAPAALSYAHDARLVLTALQRLGA
jgi:8-oxo-dGTP pyrophosphatase MutT (NUDIX family)